MPEIAEVKRVPLPAAVEALVAEASAEIARFDVGVGAEIAPFAAVLLRSESAASSKMEHLTASAKAIALAELGDPSRHNAAEIVANCRAMRAALALAEQLDEAAILGMHAVLLASSHPEWCGAWRREQVWIGGSDGGPLDATYVAPHHDRVPAAMHDLVRFLSRDDLPPLTQAAVAHAQFETIHPFPDGNGRVGRALIHALLRGKGLTRQVTVPVSAGLLTDTDGCFGALGAYRDGDPAPLVRQVAKRRSPGSATAAGSSPTPTRRGRGGAAWRGPGEERRHGGSPTSSSVSPSWTPLSFSASCTCPR